MGFLLDIVGELFQFKAKNSRNDVWGSLRLTTRNKMHHFLNFVPQRICGHGEIYQGDQLGGTPLVHPGSSAACIVWIQQNQLVRLHLSRHLIHSYHLYAQNHKYDYRVHCAEQFDSYETNINVFVQLKRRHQQHTVGKAYRLTSSSKLHITQIKNVFIQHKYTTKQITNKCSLVTCLKIRNLIS